MKIRFFQKLNSRENHYSFFKEIELDFIPQKGIYYVDKEDKKVYLVDDVFLVDTQVCISLEYQSRSERILESISGSLI